MFDVMVEREITASPDRVAAIFFDPHRDAEWMGGAKRAEILTPEPYGVGSRVRREGAFLGKKIVWVSETTEFEPGRRARMSVVEGPFVGDIDYLVEAAGENARVLLRNRGSSAGMPDWLSAVMVRMSTKADLRRLAALAEAHA